MADKVIAAQLILDSQAANQSVKSFKTELREGEQALIDIQNRFGATSKEALAVSKHVASIRDRMKDAKEVSDLFDPGAKFQAFGNVLRTVTGGFSALTGTMALFGAENKEIEKSLLKVQAALAITEGVNTLVDATKDFQRLNALIQQSAIFQKANAAATMLASGAMKLFGVSVNTTTFAFKALKAAIVATGIGVLVIAIGFLVEKLMAMGDAADAAAKAQERLKIETDKLNESLQNQLGLSDRYAKEAIASAKARGASLEEITKLERKAIEDRIFIAEVAAAEAKARGLDEKKAGDELSKEKQALRLFDYDQQVQFLAKQKELQDKAATEAKARAEKLKQTTQERLQSERSANDELQKLRDENRLAEIKNEDERARAQILQDSANERKRIEALKVNAETKLQLILEINRKEANDIAALDEEIEVQKKEKAAERLAANLEAMTAKMEEDAEKKAEEKELQLELEEELAEEERTRFESELAYLDEQYKARLSVAAGNEALQLEVTRSYEKQKSALVREENQQRLAIAGSLLGQASQLFAKHTAAYKVLATAQATIQTFQSAQGAFTGMVSSIPGPVGIALGIAAAAAAVASGIANIKKIVSTKVPGAEGGGGGGIPSVGASAPAPVQPQAQVNGTFLDQGSINNIGSAVSNRAYVVSEDVANDQERITRLNRAARLGN
jgi:hypothetical protein